MNTTQPKVFCIGLSKTGTTSLARALEMLGYRTRDYLGIKTYTPGDLSSIDLEVVDNNEAFTDTPIPSFYKELDTEYPGSKFILTVRDMEQWLKSCKKQFTQKHAVKRNKAHHQLFMDIYGCSEFDESKFKFAYEKFVNGVFQYFRERQEDLLVLDVSAGDGWEKLSPFLGKAIPDAPFPRANVTQIRWINVDDIVDIARLAGKATLQAYETIQANHIKQDNRRLRNSEVTKLILAKASYTIHGGAAGTQRAAIKKAHRIILKGLNELNPRIPVISRESHAVPYSERCKWNHFWLVDTFGNDGGLQYPDSNCTISISLIEDCNPNLGIVYSPAANTTYYAMGGKSAFKVERDGIPRRIERYTGIDNSLPSALGQSSLSPNTRVDNNTETASAALKMCQAIKCKSGYNVQLNDTMEWQTAGAHAILNAVGMIVMSLNSGKILTYNKKQFKNEPIFIK